MTKPLMFCVALMCVASVAIGIFVAMRTTSPSSISLENAFIPPTGRATTNIEGPTGTRRVRIAMLG